MTPTPEWTAADEDDADRARAVFRDRGDIINRLITERDEARAGVERLSNNLSDLLCDLTRGKLSKPTYDVRTMLIAIEDEIEKDVAEETETVRGRAEAAEAEVRDLRAKVAAVEALHGGTHWCFDADGQDVVFERGTQWWPCSTLAALAPVGRTEPEGARCPGCGSATCQWKRLECESPVNHEEHRPLEVRRYDGWIDCVVCSCDSNTFPTTSHWLETHWSGDREAGVQVLRDLIAKQAAAPAPEAGGE